MKRLYLSFAMLALLACGGTEGDDIDDGSGNKPGKPRPKKPDAGAQVDAGPLADGGAGARDAGTDTGARPDSSAQADTGGSFDANAAAGSFEGAWQVVLVATAATTCTDPRSYEARIEDTWQFNGETLTGDHLGPNPYERAAGADVWNTGETTIAATADLELVRAGAKTELRGTFIFYRDTCDVFYTVTGVRP